VVERTCGGEDIGITDEASKMTKLLSNSTMSWRKKKRRKKW